MDKNVRMQRINGNKIGIGLRHPHYQQILEEKPAIDWLEVHTENFMLQGGPLLDQLFSIRQHYPLSFHGVGLSLGSAQPICQEHLKRIKKLVQHFDPVFISDHLSWSRIGHHYVPDLLPLPYNDESLTVMVNNIDQAQNYLQRTLLIENPSSYLEYQTSTYTEAAFLTKLVKRTDAKILLDVNNLYVSSFNHGWDPCEYLRTIPLQAVEEIHVAGHSEAKDGEHVLLIDSHDHVVCQEVWDLYRDTVQQTGLVPTLLEWDTAIPALEILLQEAKKAVDYVVS